MKRVKVELILNLSNDKLTLAQIHDMMYEQWEQTAAFMEGDTIEAVNVEPLP